MPRLTGDELVKMIKVWKPAIEVIMVTAVHNLLLERERMENGAFAYITKPVNFEQLEENCRRLLRVQNQKRKLRTDNSNVKGSMRNQSTRNPKRTIAVAVLVAVFFSAGWYLQRD